eukprot:6185702-Pleurochrysis_carterae.AAC.1
MRCYNASQTTTQLCKNEVNRWEYVPAQTSSRCACNEGAFSKVNLDCTHDRDVSVAVGLWVILR